MFCVLRDPKLLAYEYDFAVSRVEEIELRAASSGCAFLFQCGCDSGSMKLASDVPSRIQAGFALIFVA